MNWGPHKLKIFLVVSLVALVGLAAFLFSHETAPTLAPTVAEPALGVLPSSPLAVVTPPPAALRSEIRTTVESIAHGLKTAAKADEAQEARVKEIATSLSAEEAHSLALHVISRETDAEERSATLYLLTQGGKSTNQAIAKIAASPTPQIPNSEDAHSVGALQSSFESSLRVTAIEALDQRVVNGEDLKAEFDGIQQQQTDPTLQFLAQLGRQGKTGKFMEAMLKARK